MLLQFSSQDFFIEQGKKTGVQGYIVMVHCFSQSVFFFIIKPRNKKKEGKKRWERKRNKKEGTNDGEKIGRKKEEKKGRKKEGKKERNKTLGRARDLRANGAWLNKLTK